MRERRNDLEITNEIPQNCFCRSQTRINLLFTMSDITHAAVHPDCACELMFRGRLFEAPSMNAMRGRTLIRKTSLLRKINPMMRRSSFINKDIYNPLILR